MGNTAYGRISYGLLLKEGQDQPWDTDDGDFMAWWIDEVCGYEPPFALYDDGGEYIDKADRDDREKVDRYWAHRRAFEVLHPCPVVLLHYGSYDYESFILTIPAMGVYAEWGEPKAFHPGALLASKDDDCILTDFAQQHGLVYTLGPCWWLSSFYG